MISKAERIACSGRNCIIVGRNAAYFLRDYDPFRIFVCAEMEAKLRRCRERAPDPETITDKEIEKQIKRIDRNRAAVRELVSGDCWGNRSCYHLTVNTTDWEIKELAPAVAAFAAFYFERKKLQP